MEKQTKYTYGLVAFGVLLFAAVMNLDRIFSLLAYVLNVFKPVTMGLVLAFVMNVPMSKIEHLLKKYLHTENQENGCSAKAENGKRKGHSESLIRQLSLALTLIVIVVIFALLIGTVVPQFVESFGAAAVQVQNGFPKFLNWIRNLGIDSKWTDMLIDYLNQFVKNSLKITDTLNYAFNHAVSTVSVFAGGAFQCMIAVIIMAYILLDKERLLRQGASIAHAFLPKAWNEKASKVLTIWCSVYNNFFTGQCTEAFILSVLMIAAFALFRLPFGGIVGVLSGVLSFIPYVGSFLACGVGVLLTLMIDPWKALLVFVVYQAVQFMENQFIYPRVVGSSVGLPPIWIVISVLVGGNLFGIMGMLFAIPVMATIYVLLKEAVGRKK